MKSPVIIGLKICKKCHQNLPLSAFRQRKLKNGEPYYIGDCRLCEKDLMRIWKLNNPEYFSKYNKDSWKEDYETVSEKYIKTLARFKNSTEPIEKIRVKILLERKVDKTNIEYQLTNKHCKDCGCKIDQTNLTKIKKSTGRIFIPSLCRLCKNARANKSHRKVCQTPYFKEKNRKRAMEYYQKNRAQCMEKNRDHNKSERYKKIRRDKYRSAPEKHRKEGRDHYDKNREKLKEKSRLYKGDVEKITDGYAKQIILGGGKQKNKSIPKDVIELKRAQLLLTRELKKQINEKS